MSILAIRPLDEPDDDLYPTPTAQGNSIVLHPDDGERLSVPIQGIELAILTNKGHHDLLALDDIRGFLIVTDCRVAVISSKYDKGTRWSGGLTAMALNVGSRALAGYKSRGTCLVGHVRYAWLSAVGGHTKAGWADTESLRLAVNAEVDGVLRRLHLDVTLPKTQDSTSLARQIAQRAANYRLAANDADSEDELRALQSLAHASRLDSTRGEYALHQFPSSYRFAASTADLSASVARRAEQSLGHSQESLE
jgi:hypothetical protein